MASPQIDYAALAKQAGAVSSQPAGTVDYAALAKEAGAVSSQPAAAKTAAAQPKQESMLGHAWDWVNKGIISKDTMVRAISGMTPEQLNSELAPYSDETPRHAAIREFVRGAIQDTGQTASGFTSPLAVASMGVGAAGKIPGAVGTIAKAVTGAVGAGFAVKGAEDIHEAGLENTPEAWQQRLQGGAMVAGGAAGAAEGTRGVVKDLAPAAKEQAANAYQRGLKPSTTLGSQKISQAVSTGLEHEIPINDKGAEKLSILMDDLNQKVKAEVASNPNAPINKFKVAARLGDTAKTFQNQVSPTSDLNAISETGNDFLSTQPNQIRAEDAQALKQGTYAQLKGKAYGELKSATIESQKALARGLKEELEGYFPEIKNLNAQQAQFYNLDAVLEKAVERIKNRNAMSIGSPVLGASAAAVSHSTPVGIGAWALKTILDKPEVSSRLAIMLNKGANGALSLTATRAKIAAVSNALAASATSDESDSRSSSTRP